MKTLHEYLRTLPKDERAAFAVRCGTTIGYLRTAIHTPKKLGCDLCMNIERESGGAVLVEDLRPDADWAYIRGTSKRRPLKAA